MRSDIEQYIRSCESCQRIKSPSLLHPLPIPGSPFDSVSLDFITRLPKLQRENEILVVDNRLTKYVLLFPCVTTITAPPIAVIFSSHVIPLFGWPFLLVSDLINCTPLHSGNPYMHGLLAMSTAYHLETDDCIVDDTLSHFLATHQKTWSHLLAIGTIRYQYPLGCVSCCD